MMANQKCAPGADTASDALQAIVNKALGYPKVGVHIGGGRHVDIPATWDGQGACPPGWTQHAVSVWFKDALTAWVPITDAQATELQKPGALSLLNAAEQTTLSSAIVARVVVDPEALGGSPKVVTVAQSGSVTVNDANLDAKGTP